MNKNLIKRLRKKRKIPAVENNSIETNSVKQNSNRSVTLHDLQQNSRIKVEVDSTIMLQWLKGVSEWGDYDWEEIVVEFGAMVQAFIHHLSDKNKEQDSYRKVFLRWGWKNWKFAKKLQQSTFEKIYNEIDELHKQFLTNLT